MDKTSIARILEQVRGWIFQYGGSLLMDQKQDKQTFSLGRISMILLLSQMVYFWHVGQADSEIMPDGMIEVFLILSGYVFGTKTVNVLDRKWQNKPARTTTKKK